MQSKTTRGVRHLLVSTGVISLVLSVAAPAALAEKPEERMIWVCHGTGSDTNPYEINLVSVNAEGHEGEELSAESLEKLSGVKNKAGLRDLDEGVLDDIIAVDCVPDGSHGSVPIIPPSSGETDLDGGVPTPPVADTDDGTDGDPVVVTPPTGGIEEPPGQGGVIPGTGDQTPPHQDDDPIVTTPSDEGIEEPPGQGGVIPGTGEQTPPNQVEVDPVVEENLEATPPAKPVPVISTVTITRPAPATPAAPAAPAAPATPATPAAPAAPAQPAVTSAPTTPAPSVAASATSRGNEVLGSVTTRTPGGTKVTALAATGTSTTLALGALGAVLLLAGLGLQVGARRRVRSSDVGA